MKLATERKRGRQKTPVVNSLKTLNDIVHPFTIKVGPRSTIYEHIPPKVKKLISPERINYTSFVQSDAGIQFVSIQTVNFNEIFQL